MSSKKSSSKPASSMEELLAKADSSIHSFVQGEKVEAKLLWLGKKSATFDIGGKSEGVVVGSYFDEARNFLKDLSPGDKVVVEIVEPEAGEEGIVVSVGKAALSGIWEELVKVEKSQKEIKVLGKTATRSGIVVEYRGVQGFVPRSQLGSKAAARPESLVGKKFAAKIIELDQENERIILSEKAVSEADQMELVQKALAEIKKDEVYEGEVVKLTNFGAFVEIKVKVDKKTVPVEGLVHVSEIAWEKVARPEEVLSEGEKVKVRVKAVDIKEDKLALSIKAAQKDPWEAAAKKYKKDQKIKGKVVKISDFGVFIELEPGIEGLLHMTKIPPGKKLSRGEEVNCFIEEVDEKERRISLGLVLTAKPVGYK